MLGVDKKAVPPDPKSNTSAFVRGWEKDVGDEPEIRMELHASRSTFSSFYPHGAM